MQLTRDSEYALEGLAFLATMPDGVLVPLATVADARRLPASFLAKIFQRLARHGLLNADRGRCRGYGLARPPRSITIREVLEAVEGPRLLQRCLLWRAHCDDDLNPCPLHYRLKVLKPALASVLETTTLAEHAGGFASRSATGSMNPR